MEFASSPFLRGVKIGRAVAVVLLALPTAHAQPLATEPSAPSAAPGSAPPRTSAGPTLYSETNYMSLTSDRRPRRVGDLLTVVIYENSSATSSADTGSSRDGSVGGNIDAPGYKRNAGLGASNEFSAGGRTQRAGRALAQLTVSIVEIAPNQDLVIRGEQLLEINGEKQSIRLEGRVRQKDVSEQNSVLSTRVADARIAMVGEGVLGDKQTPAWWQRLLTFFGL